jgi:hypothetical protein
MGIEHKEIVERSDLVALFAPTVGHERSAAVVDAATQTLGLRGLAWSSDETAQLIGEIGRAPGILGLVSRLALARLRAGQAYRNAGGLSP